MSVGVARTEWVWHGNVSSVGVAWPWLVWHDLSWCKVATLDIAWPLWE